MFYNSKKTELKSEAVVRSCSVKGVSKNFEKFFAKYRRRIQKSLLQAFSCEFCEIFKNIYFLEHLWLHTSVKWTNETDR